MDTSPGKFCKFSRFAKLCKLFKALGQLLQLWLNTLSLCFGKRHCRLCLSELSLAETFLCKQCGQALQEPGGFVETLPGDTVLCLSRFTYHDRVRLAVQAFKYGRRCELTDPLAAALSELLKQAIDTENLDPRELVITPVPLHKNKLKERGFNQSALLASLLAKRLGLNYKNLLSRRRATLAQYGLTKAERFANVAEAFSVKKSPAIRGKTVILIDDVVTSGATALSCGKCLTAAGAKRIIVLALCRARLRQSETLEPLGRAPLQPAATLRP
jgi:competence protein ComFC